MATKLTIAQEKQINSLRVFIQELGTVELEPTNCPLLANQLDQAILLAEIVLKRAHQLRVGVNA